MQNICNKFIEIKFSVGCLVCDADYDNIQTTPIDSNSSIDFKQEKKNLCQLKLGNFNEEEL